MHQPKSEPVVHALLTEHQNWTLDEMCEAQRERHGLILTNCWFDLPLQRRQGELPHWLINRAAVAIDHLQR